MKNSYSFVSRSSNRYLKRAFAAAALKSSRNSFACRWLLANFANCAMMVSKFTSTEGPATMPTRNVNLTNDLDHFVAAKVKSGRYENASEVVRAGLRTLEREEQQYKAKLAVAAFRFSRRAEADLLSIADYTLRRWGSAQAAGYLGELEVCCQMLADNPALGRFCEDV